MDIGEIPPAPEVVKTRNFRHAIDIESLYRFINDHGLRREAHSILKTVLDFIHKDLKKKNKKLKASTK